MVGHRRKSWVLKSSSQGSAFTSLTDGRTNSFYQSRRSVAGTTGVLNAPQVVVSVTDEGAEAAQNGVQQKKSRPHSSSKWFPFPRIHIPFFSRGTKHEHKPESPCRNGAAGQCGPQTTAQDRQSADVPGLGRTQTLPGGFHTLRNGFGHKWLPPAYSRSLDQQCYSSRVNYHQPFSPAPHRNPQVRAGSLDFWSSSLALAGLHPDGDIDPETHREPYSIDLDCKPSDINFQNSGVGEHSNILRNGMLGGMGKSASTGDFDDPAGYQNQSTMMSTAAGPLSPVWQERSYCEKWPQVSYENFHNWQSRARHSMDGETDARAFLNINVQSGAGNEGHGSSNRESTSHRLPTSSRGRDNRLSIDSVRCPFGSFIEDDSHRTSPGAEIPTATPDNLAPIMMYSETLDSNERQHTNGEVGVSNGSHFQELSYDSRVHPPPPPPMASSYAFGSAIYHRSLYFEQLVLKDPVDLQLDNGEKNVYHPPPPVTVHPDDYLDIPDYPTTIASCSNRSHLHQNEPEVPDEMEEEDVSVRAWLDELEGRVAYRRKECTYRIACQRAFMMQMKEKLQASKLAFNRLKCGLGPELSEKVIALRMRFGGKRRIQKKEKLSLQMEEDEYDLWGGPMLEMEIEAGYETDSSWISADDDTLTA